MVVWVCRVESRGGSGQRERERNGFERDSRRSPPSSPPPSAAVAPRRRPFQAREARGRRPFRLASLVTATLAPLSLHLGVVVSRRRRGGAVGRLSGGARRGGRGLGRCRRGLLLLLLLPARCVRRGRMDPGSETVQHRVGGVWRGRGSSSRGRRSSVAVAAGRPPPPPPLLLLLLLLLLLRLLRILHKLQHFSQFLRTLA